MHFLYKDNQKDWHYIREEVFVKEQGFQNEFDNVDTYAIHITMYEGDCVIGCARCFMNGKDIYRIGRIAVLPAYRKQGIGSKLVQECEHVATYKKAKQIVLDAQYQARSFYEILGYHANGKEHMDEHVLHIEMIKDL